MFECLDKLRRSFVPGSIEFVYVFGRRVGRSDYEKVVRSKRMTSVAEHTSAKVVRCFDRTAALGIKVCTILDQACHTWGERRGEARNRGQERTL